MQDERFSYVILRRGPRPETTVTVSPWSRAGAWSTQGVSRDRNGDGDGKGVAQGPPPASASGALRPASLPPRVVLNQVLLDRAEAAAAAASAVKGAGRAGAAAATTAATGAAAPEGAAEEGPQGPVVAAFASRYPAYGRGLVDRLVALQVGGCWCVLALHACLCGVCSEHRCGWPGGPAVALLVCLCMCQWSRCCVPI